MRSLREEYVFVPAKVREVYLAHLLGGLGEDQSVRSSIVFCATCRRALPGGVLGICHLYKYMPFRAASARPSVVQASGRRAPWAGQLGCAAGAAGAAPLWCQSRLQGSS